MKKRQLKILSSKLKSVSQIHRLSILNELFKGPKMVGYLKAKLSIEATLLSHHLRTLREMDWVTTERKGKRVKYILTDLAPDLGKLIEVV